MQLLSTPLAWPTDTPKTKVLKRRHEPETWSIPVKMKRLLCNQGMQTQSSNEIGLKKQLMGNESLDKPFGNRNFSKPNLHIIQKPKGAIETFHCLKCDVTCNSLSQWEIHLKG